GASNRSGESWPPPSRGRCGFLRYLRPVEKSIDQPVGRIEPKDSDRVRNEIGQSIDVVEVNAAVARALEILDPADVQIGGACDAFDLSDDLGGRRERFDGQPLFGGAGGAGGADEVLPIHRLADVGRAEVEAGIFTEVNPDAIEIAALEG